MLDKKLTIAFARRGYSPSGGAERYLKRLARAIVDLGHEAQLVTTDDWPPNEWPFGKITRLGARSTTDPAGAERRGRAGAPALTSWVASESIAFANELEKSRPQLGCDVLMSLERIWRCDVYRAGDGVHRAWLDRRTKIETPLPRLLRVFNRKHRDLLRLEKSLLDDRGAERVIVNSQMVKDEIVDLYNYRPDKIDIVRNGVPLEQFQFDPELRKSSRADLKLEPDEMAILFVGSGWERKGLRFAIEAVELCNDPKMHLLVVGDGNQGRYKSPRVQFLGELVDLSRAYAAADIFILPTIYDPFSNACLEALACGMPVITTRANGFSEIIEDKIHGSIIELASDVAALRDALILWSNHTRRSAARSTIMQRASQFDISKNVGKTLEILVQVAARAESTFGKIRKT
jgi:UDP-glucose:(heptosyl)LPS alpha-1,3-glucosyltransferase